MKKIIAVGLLTILCGGCGGVGPTSFGLALIDSGVKGVKARDKNPTVDASWLNETTEAPTATFKPEIEETEEPVKMAQPTAEQMQRINEMTEKIRRQQAEKNKSK